MKCPHCLESFFEDKSSFHQLGADNDGSWLIFKYKCPSCWRWNFTLKLNIANAVGVGSKEFMVWPKAITRTPLPKEVPDKYADDYKEACLVLPDSPKASAALSRRCLQLLLRDEFKVNPSNLDGEIQEVIDSRKLPTYISDAIDAVRIIGNFAAHPLKSTKTGEILPVEPGEAEWQLTVLESVFDFCFVSPEKLKQRKTALNQKLADAGKPPMK